MYYPVTDLNRKCENMAKSIIIFGGGLTSLAVGCYGLMNCYRTSIFEMINKAGGIGAGWKRTGYTIDGAMHWFYSTKPRTGYYKLWEKHGAEQKGRIISYDKYSLIKDESGKVFTIF